MLQIIDIPVLADNYIYILHDDDSGATAVIDPAISEPVLAALSARGWKLDMVLNTHHHHDHIGANLALKLATGCHVVGAASDAQRIPGLDKALIDGDCFMLGQYELQALNTPGHTSGHIVYYCPIVPALFCGDTLFSLGCGRLFEGSPQDMLLSLQRIKSLPAETLIYCTHEYTLSNALFALTVDPNNLGLQQYYALICEKRRQGLSTLPSNLALELATNPFLRTDKPILRSAVGCDDTSDEVEVFARLRRLKDDFKAD